MIYLEWNSSNPQREFTPEEIEAKDRHYRDLMERGFTIPDRYWGDGITLSEMFWDWHKALMVRTADGTWRMSYRSFCYWYASVNLADKLLCPDDPNPHFPDSAWFDSGIYPPSHKNYYQDRRATSTNLPPPRPRNPPDNRPIPRSATLITANQKLHPNRARTILWTGTRTLGDICSEHDPCQPRTICPPWAHHNYMP